MKKMKFGLGVLAFAFMSVNGLNSMADTIGEWDVSSAKNGRAAFDAHDYPEVRGTDMVAVGVWPHEENTLVAYGWTPCNSPSPYQYYSFGIGTGTNQYAITGLELELKRGGVDRWELRSSADGYANALSMLTVTEGDVYTIDIPNLVVSGKTHFALFGYSNGNLLEPAGIDGSVYMYGDSVPEPATVGLLALAGVGMWISRRFRM